MRKSLLAFSLSLLVSVQLLAVPHRPVHRPMAPKVSPIAHFLAQIRSILRGDQLATGEHELPPPPSTVIAGS